MFRLLAKFGATCSHGRDLSIGMALDDWSSMVNDRRSNRFAIVQNVEELTVLHEVGVVDCERHNISNCK